MNGVLGQKIFSELFNIGRGVVQGDIVSPILFILALDNLIQLYDKSGSGVMCGPKLTYRVLGYADDAALIEARIEEMTERLTELANKSVSEADMQIRMDKTYTQHVQEQEKVTVSEEEVLAAQKNSSSSVTSAKSVLKQTQQSTSIEQAAPTTMAPRRRRS